MCSVKSSLSISCCSAIDSISVHRKTTLQKSLQKTLKNSDDLDHPAAKRQRLSIHGDPGQRSGGEAIAADCDALTQFEAELYQSLGTMLSGQGQYADALHYYRLAAQLLPGKLVAMVIKVR